MAAVSREPYTESKQSDTLSPKLKHRGFRIGLLRYGKENARDTLCRNVTIYGKCRYEDKGCAFNHKLDKPVMADGAVHDGSKRALNVDSPSFTPSFLVAPAEGAKKAGSTTISPKALSAAPFLPKTVVPRPNHNATIQIRPDTRTPEWAMEVQEFVPRRLDSSAPGDNHEIPNTVHNYDHYPSGHQHHTYLDPSMNGAAYYQNHTFQQPVQYHLYAPIGPHSTNLHPHQRTVHDLFLSNDIREDVSKKMAAALQTLPNSQLPTHIESYHSLVPLDSAQRKGSGVFGSYNSWVYKAQNSLNGQFSVLRRIEGFRLTSEAAIRSVQSWKHIDNASVVRIVDAFTNRSFGDSSLFIVSEYHPLAKTLAEYHHLGQHRPTRNKGGIDHVPEPALWSYITQITSALKTIHDNQLAARVLDTTKILVTGRNRIRLNGCAVLDVIQHEDKTDVRQLQRQDLVKFGLVILAVGSNMTMTEVSQNFARAIDQFKRYYRSELTNVVIWLYGAQQDQSRNITDFVSSISNQMMASLDAALHVDDVQYRDLAREVENGRLFRLLAKLNFINERPEFEHDPRWSENGERFFLKLFRDYVFHQVDAQGHPVVDLGHVLACLNKLDAGTEERVTLISRDEQSCFVVSYKELKKAVDAAFQDLTKVGH